jgi:hypothetical protein
VRIVAESPEKQEELLDGKKVRFDDKVEYNNGDGAQAGVAKKLNFPAGTTESMDSYHMVRGCRVCGLLVDPGASSGLVGTDTLNELLNSGMVPSGRQDEVIFGPSSTTVTGISGQSDSTLAQVTLPFDLAWRRSSTSKLHRRLDWCTGQHLPSFVAQHIAEATSNCGPDRVFQQRRWCHDLQHQWQESR